MPTAAEKAQFVESVQPLKQCMDKFGDKWLKMLEARLPSRKKLLRKTSGSPTESFFAGC